jgi:hypothetical protein
MKTTFSSKPTYRAQSGSRLVLPGFSRRLARPSVGLTVSSLNAALTIDDLWDETFLDRLNPPLTRRHY